MVSAELTMRHAAWVLISVSLASACNRTEEPASAPAPTLPAPAAPTASPSPNPADGAAAPSPSAPATTVSPPPCLVPTAAEPLPQQAPAAECPPDPGPVPTLPRGAVRFPDAPGAPRVEVEIAREDGHRNRGLMYRTRLTDTEGMLFSWPVEQQRTFWMQNTCIPLDMLFLARDGTILGILEQVPVMNQAPRTIPCPAAHVLEVNAGWTRRHSVKAGSRVTFE